MPPPDEPPADAVHAPTSRFRYPGRPQLDAADAHFRRTVSRLARNKDPKTAALDTVSVKASRAIEASPDFQARLRKMDRKLARARARFPETMLDGPDRADG
ncbi:hypothetical protein OG292_22430 [Streptomyces sp. NBC_01511]|uniref:hypothetical protein n=1 Tax=Streptomyces sp. NBC_01511 TaxID=2903889 RepID=UPI0038667973